MRNLRAVSLKSWFEGLEKREGVRKSGTHNHLMGWFDLGCWFRDLT
jgi:hypothetical protein